MLKFYRIWLILFVFTAFLASMSIGRAADESGAQNFWKITSIKVCRDYNGNVLPDVEALGSYPVYSFFIPRPVWTVNGIVVEAQPIYETGRLVAFRLFRAGSLLKPDSRNTVKFSLPDQNGSKVFRFRNTRPRPGQCYEFF
ncbi:MAG: hypothetical protein P8182_13810 [Deltaproteobacteria bacterium]